MTAQSLVGVGEEEATYTDRYEVVEAVLPPSETSLVHGIAIHPTKTWSGGFCSCDFPTPVVAGKLLCLPCLPLILLPFRQRNFGFPPPLSFPPPGFVTHVLCSWLTLDGTLHLVNPCIILEGRE